MSWHVLQASLITAVLAAAPLVYVGLGELLGQRVGLMNVGLEGTMLVGAATGYAVAVDHGLALGLAAGAAAGGVFALVAYGVPVLGFGAPQVLAGFAVWFIGLGLSAQLGYSYVQRPVGISPHNVAIPLLARIPFFGKIFFDAPLFVYVGVVLVAATAWLLHWTRHGITIRAIGEDPEAARAGGIAVRRWQAFYVLVGGVLVGLGGSILSVIVVHTWRENVTAGRGFVALALVLFVRQRPLGLLWASYLFGILLILSSVGQEQGWGIPSPFLDMAPYAMTVAILLFRGRSDIRFRSLIRLPLRPSLHATPRIRGKP
jgi:general nucleoside transport system permease protein